MPTTEDRTAEAVARELYGRLDDRDLGAVDELPDPQFTPGGGTGRLGRAGRRDPCRGLAIAG